MRRSRVAALLVVVALAAGAAWWRHGARGGVPDARPPDAEATGPEAPPEEAPALAAAPAGVRPARSAPAPAPAEGGPSVAPAPSRAALVTIRLELPVPADPALADLPLRLWLASDEGDVLDPPHDTVLNEDEPRVKVVNEQKLRVVAAEEEPEVEWLRPIDPTARGPVDAWRVRGLPSGEWLALAVPAEPSAPVLGRSWGPVRFRAGSEPVEVVLPLASDATHGVLRLSARRAGTPSPAGFRLAWRGLPLRAVEAPATPPDPANPVAAVETRVPADEDVSVEALDPEAPQAGAVPRRTVRVGPGAVAEVAFELRPLVGVRIVATVPGGARPPRASFDLWRLGEGGPAHVLTRREPNRGAGEDAGVLATRLSPGPYLVLVSNVGPSLPASREMRVALGEAQDFEVVLDRTGPEVVCLVQRADGTLASGRGLWLGRLDGPSPADAVTAMVTTDEEGRAHFGPLPDGDYLVADYGASVWRRVRVEDGRADPPVLRLPADAEGAPGARIRGRVRGPSGALEGKALVSVGRPDGWQRYAFFDGRRFEIAAPEGEAVLTVHHSWFEAGRFASWSRPVVVEAGKAQSFDVRLSPR